jgi:ABC-type antimicrobial peptide transport system permease subunit
MRQRSLGHEFWPIRYRPIAQANQRGLGLVVRAEQSTQRAFMDRLRAALTDLDPNLVWSPVKTMNTLLTEDEILKQRRFVMLLLGIFAILAFLLSVIGIYGTVSYAVSQQTREFAIRLALGAPTSRILATAAGRAIRLTAIGLTFGLTGAVLSSRLLKSFLFNVGTVDAMTYLAAAVLFLAAALFASYLPARRALKVNPAVALRCE